MMKRLTWFVGGSPPAHRCELRQEEGQREGRTGVAGGVARSAAERARNTAATVVDALREGRDAMGQHEDELKARRDGRLVSLDEHVAPGDQVFVDGVEVDSGSVVVMRPQ